MKRNPSQYAFLAAMVILLLWNLFGRRIEGALYRPTSFVILAAVFAIIVWYSIDTWRGYQTKKTGQ